MFLFWLLCLIQTVLSTSVAVTTSSFVTTITSTYYVTTSSAISTSSSVVDLGSSCSTGTNSAGKTTSKCVDGASLTLITVYETDVQTLTTRITSTEYTTIYSNGPDPTTTTSPSITTTSASTPTNASQDNNAVSSIVVESSVIYSVATIAVDGGFTTSTRTETSYSYAPTSIASSGSSTSSNEESNHVTSGSGTSPNTLKIAIIVAIVLGVLLAGCLIFMIIFIRRRRRRQHEALHSAPVVILPSKGELDGASSTHLDSPSSNPSLRPPNTPASAAVVGATMNGHDVQDIQKYEMALGLASQEHVTDYYSELKSGAVRHDAFELHEAGHERPVGDVRHEVQGSPVNRTEKYKIFGRRSNPVYEAHGTPKQQDPTITRFELPERSVSQAGYTKIYTRRPRNKQT